MIYDAEIYTDGACSGNPGPGGWGAIIALHPSAQVVELGGSGQSTTNNRMEIQAIIAAMHEISSHKGVKTVVVYTDSTYAVRGINEWIHGWRRNGWQTAQGKPVENQDLWRSFDQAVAAAKQGRQIEWQIVPGHAGIAGNERADTIAVAFSQGTPIDLYRGPAAKYTTDLTPPSSLELSKAKKKKKRAPKQGYYLSLVGGTIHRDSSWKECEARVKGVTGAKFKKVANEAEEKEMLKKWGFFR